MSPHPKGAVPAAQACGDSLALTREETHGRVLMQHRRFQVCRWWGGTCEQESGVRTDAASAHGKMSSKWIKDLDTGA